MSNGMVYLVGAGPGDPGLFTLRGKMLLEQADVVVFDRLVGDEILSYAPREAELIYVGKESGRHALSQDEINTLLVEKAREGKQVVRLKGGDPFLYGRGGEEAVYIREQGLNYEVVPGITSAIAVPAYAGIPVTHRDATSSFAVITGHEKPGKTDSSISWDKISTGIGTLVFLMGVENLDYICSRLMENGRGPDTPVALIRWGTRPQQEVLTGTLDDIVQRVKDADFKPPAVIVVGEVVQLRDKLKWIENRPLLGKRIIVTRSREQASVLVRKIRELGGTPLEFPTIEIIKEADMSLLVKAFKQIQDYNWIVFTSVNAVEIFFEEMKLNDIDIRNLYGIKICAIGPVTRKKLEDWGLKVEMMPDEYRAEGVLEALNSIITEGERVLLPRARGARDILPETMRKWGLQVEEINIYSAALAAGENAEIPDDIIKGKVDYLTFTSSSTVNNFVEIIGQENISRLGERIRIACIGPITADKARELGFAVKIVAEKYTIDGLVQAILNDAGDYQGGANN
ncbi:uroporphyrinogen-iii methyltransferase / uroporphyrinogen-iii synthase [hydrocarbon metagenome]|uniref:uroporphyrinogen-III C-methyltransferase n=1 Tax=hydrocarbon metagenome TaxID=938273 RepID=A0A0W8E831_9ZZZZ